MNEPVIQAPKSECCEHCGAKTVEYRHSLNEALIVGLSRLYNAGGRANLKDLDLTRNQWDNFQKLKYWELVRAVKVEGSNKRGVWEVTSKGEQFIFGDITVPSSVITYRGVYVRSEGTDLHINSVFPTEYRKREDYAKDAT